MECDGCVRNGLPLRVAHTPCDEHPTRIRVVLRLRFYANVAEKLARRYAGEIREGFDTMNATPVDFATLGRRDALAKIATFTQSVESAKDPPPAARRAADLLRALRDLDPAVVPAPG